MKLSEAETKLRELGVTPDFIANMLTSAQLFSRCSIQMDPDDPQSVVTVTFINDSREYAIVTGEK